MSKINEVSKLFTDTKEDVLKNISNWQDYLTTASKFYKYSFDDQIMIYAQRPDASACANMEIWNKKMNRWVKRGSKGIALIRQNQGGKPRIEYVFKVSDTNEVRGAKMPYLWEMQPNYHEDVLKQLTGFYGEIKKDDFASSLMELTERAVGEHYREFLHDLNYDLENSFLEGIDELNMDVAFRNAVTTSVQSMVLTRCGFDAREYLDEDDFRGITDFNTPAVFSHLGNAINLVSNEMLLAIGAVIRESERNLLAKSIDNKRKVDYTDNIKFSTLKCKSENVKEENGNGRKGELYSERRLSDTGFTDGGFGESSRHSGQVWNNERNASQGEPQGNLQPNAARREPVASFGGGGQDSSRPSRTDDRRNDESTGSNRGVESQKSTSLGAEGNKHQATSRGSGDEGLDLRKVSGNQVSIFPTIHEQIESIAESKAVSHEVPNGSSVTLAAFSFAQNSLFDAESISFEVVDKILATGGEEKKSTSLIAGYMAFNTDLFENADYLVNHYGRGGKGFEIDGVKYSFWYDEEGISIARGNQTYHAQNKINLSWVQTAERIRNLLEKGEYLTVEKQEQSKEVYQKYVAEYFSFMYRDKAEDYTNEKLDPIVTRFVYPDCIEEICTHLTDKETLSTLLLGLKQMEQDFIADKDATMRMTFHTPIEIIGMAKNFQNEPVIFPSKEEFAPIIPSFITQDELNAIYATDNRTRHFNISRIDTYLLKLILCNLRESGMNVCALDPEMEYEDLTNNLGGCFIDLMSGKFIINVLEPKTWDENGSPEDKDAPQTFRISSKLSQHISFLKDFFRTYKDFSDREIDTIEIMLQKLYDKFGISDNTKFDRLTAKDYPILSDLYALIEEEYKAFDENSRQLYTAELLQNILLGLHSICKGAESKFFDGHTNITDSSFVTFGVKGLLQASKSLKNALLFNILSYMSNELLTNGNTAASIDEFYLFLTNLTAVEYVRNFSKRVRKKDSAVIIASQNLEDFNIEGIREYTKPLFSIPTHQFLFNAGNIDAKFYIDTLQLEQSEYNLIRYPQRGVCLYKCGNERYNLMVNAPEHKAKLFGRAGGR